ncbi:15302_t:CDS:2, partial [Cetraspora pellucida]
MRESTEVPRTFQVKFDEVEDRNLVVNIRGGNLHYKKQVPSNNEVAETSTIQQNLPEYSENSSEEEDNAGDISDVSEVDLTTTVKWREQSVKIDQHAIHPTYSHACKINIVSINLASPYTIFHRYLPINYIEQNVIKSINLCGRKNLNWVDININEYMTWLGLWVLMSIIPMSNRRFYWKTQDTHPLLLFNFQRWMSILRFEQIVSHYTLIMPNELEISDSSDPLFSVHSFINAFNTNLDEAVIPGSMLCIEESMNSWLGTKNKIPGHRKIPRKPHPVGQEWKTLADGLTNIIIQLEPCKDKEIEKNNSGHTVIGDSWFSSPKLCIALMQSGLYSIFHIKKRRGWPINYPQDMVEKLDSTYRSCVSKVTTIDNVQLIAASLRDRKPQCIIATASTIAKADEVEHVVKNNTGSTTIKFTRSKVFYEYSQAKGAVNINNQ